MYQAVDFALTNKHNCYIAVYSSVSRSAGEMDSLRLYWHKYSIRKFFTEQDNDDE
jgi:hypothetical protein